MSKPDTRSGIKARCGMNSLFCLAALLMVLSIPAAAQRHMENLGRGVVAVRSGSSQVFVSWRLLGLDPSEIGFNVYRSANDGPAVKLNGAPLNSGCNYTDLSANLSQNNSYHVRPVIGGVEQTPSGAYTLAANTPTQPMFSIPLQSLPNHYVHFVWVGDLDGDGEYDFVVNRLGTVGGQTQKLEAYKRDGTFLWRADFGPNSVDPDGVYPTSAAIDAGQWDGVTVYDLDSDGRAEVIVKSANGVTFGDGTTLDIGNNNIVQFISVLDGMTGAERARTLLPNPWPSRALGTLFGIGYCDGERPSLLIHAKNRAGGSGTPFNVIQSAWDYRGGVITNRWSIQWNASVAPPVAHQMRVVDVDGDGKDDLMPGMHVVSSGGTLLYNLGSQGVVHGDRFHIGDLDPNRPGLEGYGIQQVNPNGLTEYFHDAATGQILWSVNLGPPGPDAARGTAADVNPDNPGYEVWSFYGMRTATGTQITSEPNRPWPNFRIWWDGDVRSENLNRELVEKWNPATLGNARLLTASQYGAVDTWRDAPTFYGDIVGDWREEIIFEKSDHTEIQVFTTTIPTSVRLYTLPHNPAYRNCMTVKGYLQSHMVDYYLGEGMSSPPAPNIVLVSAAPPPASPSGLSASPATSTQINLAWTDNATNEAGFKIQRSTDGVIFSKVGTTPADVTEYQDGGLAPATLYVYRVRAFNVGGESANTNTVEATTLVGPPSAPSGLAATAGDAHVELVWNVSPGAAGYRLKRSATDGGPYATVASLATTSRTDIGLANGTTYFYVVSSTNNHGESLDSDPVSATPVAQSVYEAEEATLSGVVAANNQSGYSGTGFGDFINPSSDYIEWTISAPFSGTYELEIRYALAAGDRPLELRVNGAVVVPSLNFPVTGSWTSWSTVPVSAYLRAGLNTVRLAAIGSSGGNIDHLRRLDGVPPAPPRIDGISASGDPSLLDMRGSGGVADEAYYVLMSTNLDLPARQWSRVATNQFDANGDFSFTNAVNAENALQFFMLQLP